MAQVAVCSDIRKKHSTESEHHVEFLNVKPGCTEKKPLSFKRLNELQKYSSIGLLQNVLFLSATFLLFTVALLGHSALL